MMDIAVEIDLPLKEKEISLKIVIKCNEPLTTNAKTIKEKKIFDFYTHSLIKCSWLTDIAVEIKLLLKEKKGNTSENCNEV